MDRRWPGEVDLVGVKKRLVRATLASDRVEVPGASLQLPPMTVWLGKENLPVARQVEIDGIGKILLTRTTRDRALARVETARLPDIGLKTLIPLKRRIPRAHDTTAAVNLAFDAPYRWRAAQTVLMASCRTCRGMRC